jgi:hypothetical protein
MQNILECETYLMEQLDFNLTVFHPYKPLQLYIEQLKLENELQFVQTAWSFVNDSYYTDVHLQYPPYMIALAAIYMSHHFNCRKNDTEENLRAFRDRDDRMRKWFDGLNVHMKDIGAISNQIIDTYKQLKHLQISADIGPPLIKITRMRTNNGWGVPIYQQLQTPPIHTGRGSTPMQGAPPIQQPYVQQPTQNGSYRY